MKLLDNVDNFNQSIFKSSNDKRKSVKYKIIEKALNSLDDRERDILVTYLQYEEAGKYLPRNIMNDLCDRYNTTSVNLRQIKHRASEKVKKYIEDNGEAEDE